MREGRSGASKAAQIAIRQTTLRVQEMHEAIAGKTFTLLRRVPLLAAPVGLVQSAHDGVVSGVYAAIHLVSGTLSAAAATVEQRSGGFRGRLHGGSHHGVLRRMQSALNGVFGDHLAAENSRLAIDMAIWANGVPIALDTASLTLAFPDAGQNVCLFLHGLACDETGWQADPGDSSQVDFAQRLRADFAYTPLFLRYNTGLDIAGNGERLAVLLEQLVSAWPRSLSRLVLVGHSMGGLIAVAACAHAVSQEMAWPQATRMLICLGSPHLGSPLERLGHLATAALYRFDVTAPLGKLAAARSQGIKDLRHGPGPARIPPQSAPIAYRFLGASLAEDVEHRFAKLLGDGLVTRDSATAHAIDGDVETATLGQLGHLQLLTDARVYRQISAWLAAPGDVPPARSDLP